jgi:hypothetical protein
MTSSDFSLIQTSQDLSKVARNLKKNILSSFPSLKNFIKVQSRITLGDARISVTVYDLNPTQVKTIESIIELWVFDPSIKINLFNKMSNHAIEMLDMYCQEFHPNERNTLFESLFKAELFHRSKAFWNWYTKLDEPI